MSREGREVPVVCVDPPFKEENTKLGMVVHTFNLNTREAKAGRFL